MRQAEEQDHTVTATNLVQAKDLAHAVALSRFTLYKLAKSNEIPHYRCGKAIRFDINEVKTWMKKKVSADTCKEFRPMT